MFINQGYSVQQVLKYVGIASSTWYKTQISTKEEKINNKGRPVPGFSTNPNGTIILDSSIISALKSLRGKKFFSRSGGYHKLTEYLKRDYGFVVNHKKVYRLCSENGLLLPKMKKQKRHHGGYHVAITMIFCVFVGVIGYYVWIGQKEKPNTTDDCFKVIQNKDNLVIRFRQNLTGQISSELRDQHSR